MTHVLRIGAIGVLTGIALCTQVQSFAGETADTTGPLILDMVHHNVGGKPYTSAYEDPAVIKAMGYNGKVYFLFDSPMLAITWDSVDPDILPKGSKARSWVEQKAKRIKAQYAAC